ncbi:MAG: ATP-binding cassette domain-containing protein [bacterium]
MLQEISLNINEGECVGIVGGTGSGKTTLALHFNGLLRPAQGKIYIAGRELNYTPSELKEIRKRVGLLFQYPEHQLFGKNVFEDVSFTLVRHKELSPSAIKEKVKAACALVGLGKENFWDRSPWELSRGEMRRVALAGLLVQDPQVLILDEPTVGLDVQGKKEILAWIKTFHKEGRTVIIIAHEVEEILDLVDRLIVLDQGRILTGGTPGEVFSHLWLNQKYTFLIPPLYQLSLELRDKGGRIPARKWRNEEIIDFFLAEVRGQKEKNKNN